MKEGQIITGEEYINLCKLRDNQKINYCRIIYTLGPHTRNPSKRMQIRLPHKSKNKPGVYTSIEPDRLEHAIILSPNTTSKQTRWIECLVFLKDEGCRKIYLFFEPFFFEHIPDV